MAGHGSGNRFCLFDRGTANPGLSHLQAGFGGKRSEPGWSGARLFLEHPVHDEYAFLDFLRPGILFWIAGAEGS